MELRVRVDSDLCTGHGRCYALAPDVFESDEYGYCRIPEEVVTGALVDQARIGAKNCPEDAITVEEL